MFSLTYWPIGQAKTCRRINW